MCNIKDQIRSLGHMPFGFYPRSEDFKRLHLLSYTYTVYKISEIGSMREEMSIFYIIDCIPFVSLC